MCELAPGVLMVSVALDPLKLFTTGDPGVAALVSRPPMVTLLPFDLAFGPRFAATI
jgi:hypothetical protein